MLKGFITRLKPGLYLFLIGLIISHNVYGQEREWEFDKSQRESKEEQIKRDSTLAHLKGRLEIGLNYGRWTFANGVDVGSEAFEIDRSLNLWQFGVRWHFNERFFANFSLGFQLNADEPDQSSVFSQIFSGDSIQIEGSGVSFIPINFGLNYYIKDGRFRPSVGIGFGQANAISRYIRAEGATIGDIQNEEIVTRTESRFGEFNVGFDYRLGQGTQITFRHTRYIASKFETDVGGYDGYTGSNTSFGFLIIL